HLDVQLLNSLGGHEYETGRLDESLKHFQDALEKVTDLYERRNLRTEGVVSSATRSLVTIGHVLNDQRKPAEALSYYQRAKKPLEDL
ncbi:tetratricopeptide repeat protein, partial [Bacillus atrophaeus]|uniref:tetratricopeptide repeat protein n=1 Tax=Bacillus atrophaeus TaxID=1452 RepID=UPI001EFC2BEF